ncbi:MAG: DUF433 domain-containing protein [Chloroflexota bacterium]
MLERSQSDQHPLIAEYPDINGGYPVIARTRIGVRLVVEAYRELGDLEATIEAFPQLNRSQVRAALNYYEQHQRRVDEDSERHRQALDRIRSR